MGAQMCRGKRPKTTVAIFMGLSGAGKTTILHHLMYGEFIPEIPKIGRSYWERFTVETTNIMGRELEVQDGSEFRPLFSHFSRHSHGLVYVIDSADQGRLDQALDELVTHNLLDDSLKKEDGFVCMVLANKQDLEGAMSEQEIEDALKKKMDTSTKTGKWSPTVFVCPVSAATGQGIDFAFKTFVEQMNLKKKDLITTGLISVRVDKEKEDKEEVPIKSNGAKELYKNSIKYIKSILFY